MTRPRGFSACLLAAALPALFAPGPPSLCAAEAEPAASRRILTGWGGGKAEDVVPKAADVGFSELVVHHEDTANFTRFIELGKQHGIGIYAWLYLGDLPAWKKAYPDDSPPLQMMSSAENGAFERIKADPSVGKSQYQFGGEPVQELEVLLTPLLCFHDARVPTAFEKQIQEMLSVPGIRGVAFDYIGYQNYQCCRCPESQKQLGLYRQQHPELPEERALAQFSLETLVAFNNRLSAYARTTKSDAKVITHIYPVYLPEPLYGNRLDLDVCGQTAAWFFDPFWSLDKIREYSRVISGEEKRHHQRAHGAALIGYYNSPTTYAVKSRERLTAELQAIVDGGCTRVHVCSFNHVLTSPAAADVFRTFFGPSVTP